VGAGEGVGDPLHHLVEIGREGPGIRLQEVHPPAIHQHRVVVHQAHAGDWLGVDVSDLRGHDVVEPAHGQLGEQHREEIEMDAHAERRKHEIHL
jgi:hypothetical protein